MTTIWTQRGVVENDPWIAAGEDAGFDGDIGHQVLPLADVLEHAQALSGSNHNTPFGVVLQPADDVRALAPILDKVSIIFLTFPAFSDGRAFSQAMLLKDRLAYKGELRAVGNVLLDQVPLMLRTGFESFEISHGPTLARLVDQRLPGIDLHYQPSADSAGSGQAYSWRRTSAVNA